MIDFDNYNFTLSQLSDRANRIKSIPLNDSLKMEYYRKILNLVDLTTLEGSDTPEKIETLCRYALRLQSDNANNGTVAAVCIYMPFVELAVGLLQNSPLEVATVAGGFPSGQLPVHLKKQEIEYAVQQGANEVDVVISRSLALMEKWNELQEEIIQMKASCGETKMKVILETGELTEVSKIRKACECAINGGADFLKTSTGKIKPAATPEAFLIMLDTINEYRQKTGKMIGVKPAGGIATPDDALHYYLMVKETLGNEWLDKKWFRIGASRLVGNLLERMK
ncbi:MAG TPA: deoxyribose-phosphate aldolase [Bacteroidales bacterium]|nr:deoxyribose-phosphate aldolase [Bacteroidales bacterium]HQO07960.1 deoxyribose-phosphate aldolase [Bacteroidales bacterium]HQP53794.1 deoxyribose-phosphate aldolase [Bacteroidales bacterium]